MDSADLGVRLCCEKRVEIVGGLAFFDLPDGRAQMPAKQARKEMEEWRGNRFKTEYLPLVRPFSTVPDLLRRAREAGLRIAVASSAKKEEVDKYLDIARIIDLVDLDRAARRSAALFRHGR
jgi:phosphoglycolate phosphatase-like HAD superfamily hydrolase